MDIKLKSNLEDIVVGDTVVIRLPGGAMREASAEAVSGKYIRAGGIEFLKTSASERGAKGIYARTIYAPLDVIYATGTTAVDLLAEQRNEARQQRLALIAFLREIDYKPIKTSTLLNVAKMLGYEHEE